MSTTLNAQDITFQESETEALRIDLYALLAYLLSQPPSADGLSRLANLYTTSQIPVSLVGTLHRLQNAASQYDFNLVKREYEDLFIGMGRGEIVPYASWYSERLVMARPLVRLRVDLRGLGILRQYGVCEPEDHAAALCETMVLILRLGRIPVPQQVSFFNNHLASWMIQFFRDLQKARSAGFYRFVGRLGEQFLLLEKKLLQEKPIEEV